MKNSFIIPRGVGVWFNVCWHMLKHVKANDMIIRLHLHHFACAYFIYIIQRNVCRKVQFTLLKLVEKFKGQVTMWEKLV
jgi:hypothetical protein